MAKILVVDDDADLLKLLRTVLLERGHEVETALDGRAAIDLASCEPPDLLITDLLMPGLDGYELIGELREQAVTRAIPVIVLSELSAKESRLVAFRIGCDEYIAKPFDLDELCARVEQVVRRGKVASIKPASSTLTMQGCLGELALPSVLALLETDKNTGVLELKAEGSRLRLHLEGGRVVHAEDMSDPRQTPFEVVCRALRLSEGKFAVFAEAPNVSQDLGVPMTQLLLEAFRRIDEEDARVASGVLASPQ